MLLSIQAICGAMIGSVVFAIGLATWLRDRRNDNAPDTTSRVAPAEQKRAAVRL